MFQVLKDPKFLEYSCGNIQTFENENHATLVNIRIGISVKIDIANRDNTNSNRMTISIFIFIHLDTIFFRSHFSLTHE